jgi:hypothetical protein
MKTIHQHIDTDLQTLTGSTTPWVSSETAPKRSSANGLQIPAGYSYNQTLVRRYQQIKTWIRQMITSALEGQVAYIDGMTKNGSPLYPYNFTGSPQALFLLPHSYRPNKAYQVSSLPDSEVKVKRLDEHRYEVKFNHKTADAIIHIYDESGELLFSEQIFQKGTFNLVYNLQWTGISQASFEVVTQNRLYRSAHVQG